MASRYQGYDDPYTQGYAQPAVHSLRRRKSSQAVGHTQAPESGLPPWQPSLQVPTFQMTSMESASPSFDLHRRPSQTAAFPAGSAGFGDLPSLVSTSRASLAKPRTRRKSLKDSTHQSLEPLPNPFKAGIFDPFFTPSPLPPWLQDASVDNVPSAQPTQLPDMTIDPKLMRLNSTGSGGSPRRPRRKSVSEDAMDIDVDGVPDGQQRGRYRAGNLRDATKLQVPIWTEEVGGRSDRPSDSTPLVQATASPQRRRQASQTDDQSSLSLPSLPPLSAYGQRSSLDSLNSAEYSQRSRSSISSTSTSRMSSPLDSDFGFGAGRGFSPSLTMIPSSPATSVASSPCRRYMDYVEEREAPAAPDWWKNGLGSMR